MISRIHTLACAALGLIFVAGLQGCAAPSSGTGTTTPAPPPVVSTVSGVVATGAAVSGATVTLKDSSSITKSVSGTSDASGAFSLTVTGMTPPFMLRAAKSGAQDIFSFLPAMDMAATSTKTVNITTLSNVVMYEMASRTDPGNAFTGETYKGWTASGAATAQTAVRNNLPLSGVPSGFNLLYDSFTPGAANDPYDAAMASLKISQSGAVVTYLDPSSGIRMTYGLAVTPPSPTLALQLTDTAAPYASRTSVTSASPGRVKATLKDAAGIAVSNAIVTFTTDPAFGTLTPNVALTDASGNATVILSTTNNNGGAATVTANTSIGSTPVGGTLNYAVGASSITLGPLQIGANPLSAYGTTSISVSVFNNGSLYTTPLTVNFTSTCAASGKASITSSVTTSNGVATVTYLDNQCNGTDTISATVINGATPSTASLTVNPPGIGSLQFVSASPTSITLKGTGGTGRQEVSHVTFKVVDQAGKPFGGQIVTFSLNTSVGGISFAPASATSDAATGIVGVDVTAGNVATPVRVTATTANGLSTQSDQLTISTGIPAQDAFSMSATTHNIEGWGYDGTTTTVTVRLADHFHNPVPDGTAVSFITEGGAILPSCTTVGGVCSTTLTSQSPRPSNGRVTVLGYAVGEEAFTDLDGNGLADPGEMIDINGASTDKGEAFLDINENGVRDANETFIDFNNNGGNGASGYDGPDGKYSGLLCNPSAKLPDGSGFCSLKNTIHVRDDQVIVFSTSFADIAINGGATIALPPCVAGVPGGPLSFIVTVVDRNGNAMPAGSTISLTTSNGVILTAPTLTVSDTTGCRRNYSGCPANKGSATFGSFLVSMQSDATGDTAATPPTCTNTNSSGVFTVTVTTPKGNITTATATVTD